MPQCLRCKRIFTDDDGFILVRDASSNKVELVYWFDRTHDQRLMHVLHSISCGSCGLCNDCVLNSTPRE